MITNDMMCLCDRVKEEKSLLNAHIYPPSCVPITPLPQTQCECEVNPSTPCDNDTPTPEAVDPSGATITASSYVLQGTYKCVLDNSRSLDNLCL